MRKGVVYFIGPEWRQWRVKIGYTEAGVVGRLKALQTGSPYPLQIHAMIEGGRGLERAFHEAFAPCRLHGEWFSTRHRLGDFVSYLEIPALEGRCANARELGAAFHDTIIQDQIYPEHDVAAYMASANVEALAGWVLKQSWSEYSREDFRKRVPA